MHKVTEHVEAAIGTQKPSRRNDGVEFIILGGGLISSQVC